MSVPTWSVDGYNAITDLAAKAPNWLRWGAEVGTEAGIIVLIGLTALAFWLSRQASDRDMARVLLVPIGTVLAYLLSEVVKAMVTEGRPCLGGASTVIACPPPGDWSFPSNHSTIAASIAVGLIAAGRRWLASIAVLIALAVGCSRVFVGVHYPHDVLVGLALGIVVAMLAVLIGTRPLTTLVHWLRGNRSMAAVFGAGDSVRPVEQRTAPMAEQPTVQIPAVTDAPRPTEARPARPRQR